MNTFISVDPGLRGSGVAHFYEGKLFRAAYLKHTCSDRGPKAWCAMAETVYYWSGPANYSLVIEYQRLRMGKEKGDPNNMMEVQGVVGALAGMFTMEGEQIVAYYPEAWKGSIKKDVMTMRIVQRMTTDETQILRLAKIPSSLMHNTIDAIGIGLFHLGRLKHEYNIARS